MVVPPDVAGPPARRVEVQPRLTLSVYFSPGRNNVLRARAVGQLEDPRGTDFGDIDRIF